MSLHGSKGPLEQEIQRVRSSVTWQDHRDLPGSFMAKGGGQGWDPLVGQLVGPTTDLQLWLAASRELS